MTVEKRGRVEGLDVLRGLAVFGILVVNIEQMFLPLFLAESPAAMIPGETGTWLAWTMTDAFFRNKFVTIFSLLFGAGFCLQWTRTQATPRGFRRLYVRRILTLAGFGLLHAVFFYMADVLIIYAVTVLGLFVFRRCSGRRLLQLGVGLLVLTAGWHAFLNGPGPDEINLPERQQVVAEEIARMRHDNVIHLGPAEFEPLKFFDFKDQIRGDRALEGGATLHSDGRIELLASEYALPLPEWLAILVLDGKDEPEKAKVEYAVYSQGPLGAVLFNRVNFLLLLVLLYTPIYFGWRTLALFFIGAGIVKLGLLEEGKAALWRRAAGFGLGIGLPLTVAATGLRGLAYHSPGWMTYSGDSLQEISAILLAIGLGAVIFIWCGNGHRSSIHRGLSSVGRTALTNYIGQSVLMSLLATGYGLGFFGDFSRLQLLILALVCFGGQMVLSMAWLRRFEMGPLEWIWRCATYWRRLPLRRT